MRYLFPSLALSVALVGCATQPNNQTSTQYVTPQGEQWQVSTRSSNQSTQLLINGELIASSGYSTDVDGNAVGAGMYRGQPFTFLCSPNSESGCSVYAGGLLLTQNSSTN